MRAEFRPRSPTIEGMSSTRFAVVAALAALGACTTEQAALVEPLAALPAPAEVVTDRFRDAEACGQCHLVAEDTAVLHDRSGANVSPVLLWRSSMMALAARDPFYLAVFAEELARAPAQAAVIEATCTRCHGPAGAEELAVAGGHLTFDDLVANDTPAARLARGGVTCTLCHQIQPGNLGDERSFTGGFEVGFGRQVFGPYVDPLTMPMQLIVDYTPTRGDHILDAALCGTCHTVIVDGPAGPVVEQATYLEWRSSAYAAGRPCQGCHVPPVDDSGQAIVTAVASFPADLSPRAPVGRHRFVGGNSYMMSIMADLTDASGGGWLNAGIPEAELRASALHNEAHLRTAAALEVRRLDAEAFRVDVTNLTGHKLPTGYPSRRMWLHVTVTVGGEVVFESGGVDARGSIVDATGTPVDVQPHRDEVTSPAEVQIWEAVLVDVAGERTHRALDARRYSKDDRILPAGFAPSPIDAARVEAVGVVIDPTFLPGGDGVTYRVPGLTAGATIAVELQYASVTPAVLDAIARTPTPASVRFLAPATARPPAPVVMATTSLTW